MLDSCTSPLRLSDLTIDYVSNGLSFGSQAVPLGVMEVGIIILP